MTQPTIPQIYHRYREHQAEPIEAEVIVETPVSLTVNGKPWLTLMCTPVHLEALAVGFLYNEEIIQSAAEISSVRLCPAGDNVDVWLTHAAEKPTDWRRTSGCTGGVTSVQAEATRREAAPPPAPDGFALPAAHVSRLIAALFDAQDLYRSAGGVHTSALSDGQSILLTTEDVGRHNTLDKIAGRCLLEAVAVAPRVLLTTGRISSEMLQKARRIGASIIASRTSPTSLSIEMAEALGITLIGYARRDRLNVYTHPQRILAGLPVGQSATEE